MIGKYGLTIAWSGRVAGVSFAHKWVMDHQRKQDIHKIPQQ